MLLEQYVWPILVLHFQHVPLLMEIAVASIRDSQGLAFIIRSTFNYVSIALRQVHTDRQIMHRGPRKLAFFLSFSLSVLSFKKVFVHFRVQKISVFKIFLLNTVMCPMKKHIR